MKYYRSDDRSKDRKDTEEGGTGFTCWGSEVKEVPHQRRQALFMCVLEPYVVC